MTQKHHTYPRTPAPPRMAASFVAYACNLNHIRLQAAKPASGKATPTPSAPAEGEGEEGGEPPLPKVCQPGRSAWLACTPATRAHPAHCLGAALGARASRRQGRLVCHGRWSIQVWELGNLLAEGGDHLDLRGLVVPDEVRTVARAVGRTVARRSCLMPAWLCVASAVE